MSSSSCCAGEAMDVVFDWLGLGALSLNPSTLPKSGGTSTDPKFQLNAAHD